MIVWVDGDACPKACKEVIFRCAQKRQVRTIVVANSYQNLGRLAFVEMVVVEKEMDAADYYIVEESCSADLVITADIPLAHLLVQKNVTTISPRGELFSQESIGERVAVRNLLTELRSTGLNSYCPSFSDKDKQKFSATFDAQVSKLKN